MFGTSVPPASRGYWRVRRGGGRSHFLSSFVKTNKVNKKTPYHTFPDTHEVFAKLHT